MFCIDIKKTKVLLSELQNQLKTLNQIIGEGEEGLAYFFSEPKEKYLWRQIADAIEALKEQRKQFLNYVSSLREIIELYEETEEQILSFEGAAPVYIPKEAEWISVEYSEAMYEFIRKAIA